MWRVYSSSREALDVARKKASVYKCKQARLWYSPVYGVYLVGLANIVPHDVSVTHGKWINCGTVNGGDSDA